MSLALARRLLWLAFALTVPLPAFMIDAGRIPLLQLLMFSALTVPQAFIDPGLAINVLAGAFAVQTLAYGALLLVAARLITARLPPARRGAMVLGIAAALALLALADVYVAPLSHGPSPTNWLGIW